MYTVNDIISQNDFMNINKYIQKCKYRNIYNYFLVQSCLYNYSTVKINSRKKRESCTVRLPFEKEIRLISQFLLFKRYGEW